PVLFLAPGLAPDPVDGLAVGGRGEPRARTRRDAVDRPALDGGRERLGGHLLGDVEVPEAPGQGRDHPGPLLAVGPRAPPAAVRNPPSSGRSSPLRLQCFEPRAASRSATSRWGASIIQKPAIRPLGSRSGPSVNTAPPSLPSTTVAVLGDARPPAK